MENSISETSLIRFLPSMIIIKTEKLKNSSMLVYFIKCYIKLNYYSFVIYFLKKVMMSLFSLSSLS